MAFMMIVLLGFVGLAVDGGRGYVDRRELQDAVDAAALGAGDNFVNTNDQVSAETAAANTFAANMRISGAISQTGWGGDNATASWAGYPCAAPCFQVQVTHNAFNGTDFMVTATHAIGVAFMQVLGVSPNINIKAQAQSVVLSQSQTPALLTLSQAGCPGGPNGNSLTMNGNANVAIVGAFYSNGNFFNNSSSTSITVAGNAFASCPPLNGVQLSCYNPGPPPTGVAPTNGVCPAGTTLGSLYPNSPPLGDPAYTTTLPSLANRLAPGSAVELQPGIYPGVLLPANSGCYFLDPGTYNWSGGLTLNGALISNELRPPDEPVPGNLRNRQSPNFWYGTGNNVVKCDGSFAVVPVNCSGCPSHFPAGDYGVITTAVRSSDNGYFRESAPSMCRTFMADGTKGFQAAISNVPGAQSYNIYAHQGTDDNSACAGPFGYVGNVANSISEQNSPTTGCPFLPTIVSPTPATPTSSGLNAACSLGYVISSVYDKSNVNNLNTGAFCPVTGPNAQGCLYPTASPLTPGTNDGGLQPPAGSNLPNLSPIRDIPSNGGGDRADEDQCRAQGAGASAASPCLGATVTPGAVQFYFPPSQCLAVQGSTGSTFGDLYIFGGIQYKGIVIYAPATNTCSSMKLAGGSSTTVIGTIYMPGAALNIRGGAQTSVSGQVIVGSATIDGTSGTAITYNPALSPPAPGARLIL